MRRIKKWIHQSLWAVIIGLGLYVLAKSTVILKEEGKLEKKAADLYAPALTLAIEKGSEENGWFEMLAKEVMPLLIYWESKEVYFSEKELASEEAKETERQSDMPETEKREEEKAVKEELETEAVIKNALKKKKSKKKEEPESESEEKKREKAEEVDLAELQNFQTLLGRFYTVDASTTAEQELLNAEKFWNCDLTIKKDVSQPQILIYHTHSQEAFADSREGEISDTIVGVGDYLTKLLTERYGYQVIHNTSTFDMIDGALDRNRAYNLAEVEISQILEEHPSIEVVIDLHRDGLEGEKMVTQIDGKPTAKIMFFNGLSRSARNGEITYLPNPYIAENLAFSFQMQVKAKEYYPEFTRNIYLQSLRYNLHLKPRALLVEAGSQLNTVEEEKNAMEPLADLLHRVLEGK